MTISLSLGNSQVLIDRGKKVALLRNQMAYVLATAYWETAHTMRPIKEMGGPKYLKSKKYYPWYGRGYVQLTWEKNYIKAGKELNLDLTTDPDVVLDPTVAADICIAGMVEGWFTGKKLSDYVTLQKSDFKGARKIINGTDKDDEIAAIAVQYDKLLITSGYGMGMPVRVPSEPVQSIPVIPAVVVPSKPKPSVVAPIAIPETKEPATAFIESLLEILVKLFGAKK